MDLTEATRINGLLNKVFFASMGLKEVSGDDLALLSQVSLMDMLIASHMIAHDPGEKYTNEKGEMVTRRKCHCADRLVAAIYTALNHPSNAADSKSVEPIVVVDGKALVLVDHFEDEDEAES